MIDVEIILPKGYYTDYLKYLFPLDPSTRAHRVTSVSNLGKLLIAYAKVSLKPVPTPDPGDRYGKITLSLPLTDTTQDLQDKYLYYTSADTARLQGVLKAEFNLDFIAYYLRGTVMGHQKKEIIEMFVASRHLVDVDPYEALHKRIYRMEQRKMQELSKKLIRKANYFEEKLNTDGLYD